MHARLVLCKLNRPGGQVSILLDESNHRHHS
jgi:hypothetical protein